MQSYGPGGDLQAAISARKFYAHTCTPLKAVPRSSRSVLRLEARSWAIMETPRPHGEDKFRRGATETMQPRWAPRSTLGAVFLSRAPFCSLVGAGDV